MATTETQNDQRSKHVEKLKIAVAYGAGTNSTALLVGLHWLGVRPDFITFADTGGERAETYQYLEILGEWLDSIGFPPLAVVKKVNAAGEVVTLEQDCLNRKALPSLAYGYKTCSHKFKAAPQDKYYNNLPASRAEFKAGRQIRKLIGYDANEQRRAKPFSDKKWVVEYPLITWRWGRDECVEVIASEGLPLPGKSACFFCPSSRLPEIRELQASAPTLMDRALAMERNAELTSVKGLGRRFNWGEVIASDRAEEYGLPETPCGCYDG